jgi:multimeric flavodoxin WrbA
MKALVFNGSPLMDQGNTALILNPFIEGLKEAGADVTLHYTRQLRAEPCRGEHHCWIKHPGRCSIEDDMQSLYPALREADVWVFATPVYSDGMTAPLKNVLDRLIPFLQPFFEIRDDHCRHPRQEGLKAGKVALLATCGFWELDNFSPLLAQVKGVSRNIGREFAGALLRPHSQALKPLMRQGAVLDDVFDAAREAGRQVVRQGQVPRDTAERVGRELMSREDYVNQMNGKFMGLLKKLEVNG